MSHVALFLLVLAILSATNIAAIIISRRGKGSVHSASFASGLVGLCSVPVLLVGTFGLAAQFLYASLTSPAGLLVISAAAVLLISTTASLVCIINLARRGAVSA